jgi:sugar lactone lactonase YvrE
MRLLKLGTYSLLWLILTAFTCVAAGATTPRVTTVAGGRRGDGGPATSASFILPSAVARDANGDLYVSDADDCRIRRVSASGTITTFAGTGICGHSGDGGPAKAARISNVYGLAFDKQGNLLLADSDVIRSIAPNGAIETIAGSGTPGYSGDGGPATKARLSGALGVSADQAGNIYIADTGNNVIRKVDTAGIIRTVAGNHTAGFSGDGGPATAASLNLPWSVVPDANGNFYISDNNNRRVRKVTSGGTINTYAGNGVFGNTGSGGPATVAAIGPPTGLRLGAGKLYVCTESYLIWVVDLRTLTITIIAGNGNVGFNGDGDSALSTSFGLLYGMALDGAGGLFVADAGNNRVRHIDTSQTVSTTAGGAVNDGGPALNASLNSSLSSTYAHIAFDPSGNMYIADTGNCRVRKVSTAGIINTIAGTGICGYSGDGGPATTATLSFPQAVAVDGSGSVYIADTGNSAIRKIDPSGSITTFLSVLDGDVFTESARVVALAMDGSGNLYASDGFYAIWKITPAGQTTVVAGSLFHFGYNGDGIPATQAWLYLPVGVAIDRAGNLYISDWLNYRVRKVDTNGIISTIAGTGLPGFSGDGGPATSAQLSFPSDVTVDSEGNVYISDWANFRIRVVDPSGAISTFAGSGGFGYNGNDVLASRVNIFPQAVAVRNDILYFSDQSTGRVRKVH